MPLDIEISSVAKMGGKELLGTSDGELPLDVIVENAPAPPHAQGFVVSGRSSERFDAGNYRSFLLPEGTIGVRVSHGRRFALIARTPAGRFVRFGGWRPEESTEPPTPLLPLDPVGYVLAALRGAHVVNELGAKSDKPESAAMFRIGNQYTGAVFTLSALPRDVAIKMGALEEEGEIGVPGYGPVNLAHDITPEVVAVHDEQLAEKEADPVEYYHANCIDSLLDQIGDLERAITIDSASVLHVGNCLACIRNTAAVMDWPTVTFQWKLEGEHERKYDRARGAVMLPPGTKALALPADLHGAQSYLAQAPNGRILQLWTFAGYESGATHPDPLPGILRPIDVNALMGKVSMDLFPHLGALDVTAELMAYNKLREALG